MLGGREVGCAGWEGEVGGMCGGWEGYNIKMI